MTERDQQITWVEASVKGFAQQSATKGESVDPKNVTLKDFGRVLIWSLWIAILIIAIFAIPQVALGIPRKEAELVPIGASHLYRLVDDGGERKKTDCYERPVGPYGCVPFWCFLLTMICLFSGTLIALFNHDRYAVPVGFCLIGVILPIWYWGRVSCEKQECEAMACTSCGLAGMTPESAFPQKPGLWRHGCPEKL